MKKIEPLTGRHRSGEASRQAHTGLPANTYERELGRDGFFGPATMMYHRRPPTSWLSWSGPLRPRAFDCNPLWQQPLTPVASEFRTLPDSGEVRALPFDAPDVLHNAHCKISTWCCPVAMNCLVRNADGDQLVFVHQGAGELFCDYGRLEISAGDYVILPRGTLWRLVPQVPLTLLMIEATNGGYQLPDKGILGRHAIFDPAVLQVPEIDDAFLAQQTEDPWSVFVKHRNQLSRVDFGHNPLDAIGWQGDLMPVKLNVKDIRPVMSHRYHLPPSAHTTFVANRFVVCTFVPRPFETDADALKVPFFHNNDDYDEVIFYHAGDFFSRDNIGPGMLTFHPAGITHGPHPGALKNMLKQSKPGTDEYAVMIDTRDALTVGEDEQILAVEQKGYVDSWRAK